MLAGGERRRAAASGGGERRRRLSLSLALLINNLHAPSLSTLMLTAHYY
jgi:hypothetical protein